MPRGNENQHTEETTGFGKEKERMINDTPPSEDTEMSNPTYKRAEFAQELNPLNHIPIALELNKFEELIGCIEEEEEK